jgi:hypothetical protein
VLQDFLHIVECKSSKHCQASIEIDSLSADQRAATNGQDQRGQAAQSDDSASGQKRAAEPDVFILRESAPL